MTLRHARLAALLAAAATVALPPTLAEAARGAGRVRASAPTNVSRPAARPNNISGRTQNTAVANRSGARANNSGNRINNGDVNIGNRTNINIDNDHRWHDWDDDYHPVARGVAFGAAAAVTSAVVGSMIYSLPPACAPRPYGGTSYYYCGNVWYAPQYQADQVVYVVVNPPG